MPNHDLTTRPAVAKIKHASGTTYYSDPSIKKDPDARGIRLQVGATTKTWVLSKRIEGKVRTISLGPWPDLPTVYAARDVAKEKMGAITTKTDDRATGIRTLRDALESHIEQSDAKPSTVTYYREQVDRHLSSLFDRPIDDLMLTDLERALRPYDARPATKKHLQDLINIAFRRAAVVRRIPNLADALKKVKYKPNPRQTGPLMRVAAPDWDFSQTETLTGDDGRDREVSIPYKTVTCARCGNTATVYGHSDESYEAACVLLRESCPREESNYYTLP